MHVMSSAFFMLLMLIFAIDYADTFSPLFADIAADVVDFHSIAVYAYAA